MTAPPTPGSATTRGIAARLERLPASRWQTKIRVLIGTVSFFEAFDQLLVSYTLPLLRSEWALSTAELTTAVSAGSVGMLLGAVVCGFLADRLGRTRVVVAAMIVTAVCSLLLAVCPNFASFVVLRFLQGLGIGGEVPVAAAFVSEIARSHQRGRFVLLYELAFPAGLTFAAVVATWVVPHLGWRWLYVIGATPGLLAVLVARLVPESPRWLASRGESERAERAMLAVERGVERATGRSLAAPRPDRDVAFEEPRGRARELIDRRYRRRTVVVSVLWFCGYFINYGITAWLPTIYTSVYGVALGTALNYTLLTSAVGFAGCVVVAFLVDRLGRRPSLVTGLGIGAVPLLTLALLGARTGGSVAFWCTLSAGFVFAANIVLYLYTPELYPTRIRGLGTSLGGVWNRIGVIAGPIVVGSMVGTGASPAAIFCMLGGIAVVAALTALLGEETTGRSLEEISA